MLKQLILVLVINYVWCLRVNQVRIVPRAVREGGKVLLECLYDLNKEQLYCIKWYRGVVEFYRYCPSDYPASQTYTSTLFDVDLSSSNATQVVLQNVGFRLGGNITCEVSTDAPAFVTFSSSSQLEVVRLPQGGPVIVSEHPSYEAGDTLWANCTAPPSSPPSNVTLFMNDKRMPTLRTIRREVDKGLYLSHLSALVTLDEEHFDRGQLMLVCVAEIFDLYKSSAELVLGKKESENMRRVAENASNKIRTTKTSTIFLLLTLTFVTK